MIVESIDKWPHVVELVNKTFRSWLVCVPYGFVNRPKTIQRHDTAHTKGGTLEHAGLHLRPPKIDGRDPNLAGHVEPASQPLVLVELGESQLLVKMPVCLGEDDGYDVFFRHTHAEHG